jgi:hypothetical protein
LLDLDQKNLATSKDFNEKEAQKKVGLNETWKRINEIEDRLTAIEIAIEADHFPSPLEEIDSILKRIEAIEKKLGQPTPIALDPGDQEKFVICLVGGDGQPQKFWDGRGWIDQIEQANRYQSETSLRRTLEKLKTRKRERLDWEIRYNSIANLEKIIASQKESVPVVAQNPDTAGLVTTVTTVTTASNEGEF